MSPLGLLACLLLICTSAFMSASEVALFSLSRFQLRYLKENFRPVHRKIKRLLSDPGGLLITILVVNEVLNISLSALITEAISESHFKPLQQVGFVPEWTLQMLLG